MMRSLLPALLVLVLAAVLGGQCHERARSQWERNAAVQVAAAKTEAEARTRVLRAENDSLRAAAAVHAHSDSIARRAAARTDSLRTRIVTVREVAPPDPARDSIIDALLAVNDSLNVALALERAAYSTAQLSAERLRGELRTANARIQTLVAVIEDAPGERPWYLPKIVAGYGATLDRRAHTIHDGPSVTIGLEIRF